MKWNLSSTNGGTFISSKEWPLYQTFFFQNAPASFFLIFPIIPNGYQRKKRKNFSANALHKVMPSEWGIRKISVLQIHAGQVVTLGMPSSRGTITLDINPLGPTGYSMVGFLQKMIKWPKLPSFQCG